jgi:CubicO group peptidase (beta-lactamase class C family)
MSGATRIPREVRRDGEERISGGAGLSQARLGRLHDVMTGYVERGEIPGLVTLLSRHGEVHVDAVGLKSLGGHDPMRRDTIFRIASLTKPVTAAAAMILVEECLLRLDDPVDRWLPELANRRVLTRIDAELDDTVPAQRPITLRDLLTLRLGIGAVMAPPGRYPIQRAMEQAELAPGPRLASLTPNEWMQRLGALPLIHQPGERWMYHTGSDILGILIARATGRSLEAFMRERLFEPLGMKDTGFHVPAAKLDRLPRCYKANPETRTLDPFNGARDIEWSRQPAFPAGGGGLVSTVDDYHAFCQMLLNKGRHGHQCILSRPSVELMTTDHLTPEQKAENRIFFGDHSGWGFGMSVDVRRDNLSTVPGRFGWNGGYGTSGYTDPKEDLIGILMTQRLMDSPIPPPVFRDFWTLVYQAIDD